MAGFDSSKDRLVKHYGAFQPDEGVRLDVEARQYGDDGEVKLQIKRTVNDKFRKLGRLTPAEVVGILPYLEEYVNDATS